MGQATNWVDKRCASTEWFTPPEILNPIRSYYQGPIPFDAASTLENPTGALAWTSDPEGCQCSASCLAGDSHHDGLKEIWPASTFINPPYGRIIREWLKKIHEEAKLGREILALLPCGARFSTRYFQDNILSKPLDAVCFIRGRVKFMRADGSRASGNPYDSAIYGFNIVRSRFERSFAPLGSILLVTPVG